MNYNYITTPVAVDNSSIEPKLISVSAKVSLRHIRKVAIRLLAELISKSRSFSSGTTIIASF
jgi:hypothetical protein